MTTYIDQSQEVKSSESSFSSINDEGIKLEIAENQELGGFYSSERSEPKNIPEISDPVHASSQQYPASASQAIQPIEPLKPSIDNYEKPSEFNPVLFNQASPSSHENPIVSYPIPHDSSAEPNYHRVISASDWGEPGPNAFRGAPNQNEAKEEQDQNGTTWGFSASTNRWGFLRHMTTSFRDKTENNDRASFIKKVYSLICCQLLVTAIFVGIVCGVSELREGIKKTWYIAIASWGMTCVIMGLIFLTRRWSKQYPYNYIALFSFTIFESYIVAFICAFYSQLLVLCAAVSTLVIAVALTIYAWKTKTDFTTMRGFLVSISFTLILFGFWSIWLYSEIVHQIYCFLVILVYGCFLVYDTQTIIGGKRYQELTYDDYVIGALLVYCDLVILFLYILAESGKK